MFYRQQVTNSRNWQTVPTRRDAYSWHTVLRMPADHHRLYLRDVTRTAGIRGPSMKKNCWLDRRLTKKPIRGYMGDERPFAKNFPPGGRERRKKVSGRRPLRAEKRKGKRRGFILSAQSRRKPAASAAKPDKMLTAETFIISDDRPEAEPKKTAFPQMGYAGRARPCARRSGC